MREIKFRAWYKAKNRFLSPQDAYWCVSPSGEFCWGDDGGRFYESDDCVLQQFTGLHDKSGKEIYEGDIYLTPSGTNREVEWSFVQLQVLAEHAQEVEAIGDIYSNPELLRK
jgi:uncharacterized phage protein (TIGR01671 family)